MKSTLEKETREELITRISALTENNKSAWGRMSLASMLRHGILWEEMVLENKKYKQVFIGRIFGRIALKKMLKDDAPLGRNSPSIPDLIVKDENGELDSLKSQWIELIRKYEFYAEPEPIFVHPFFGKMTREQICLQAYKHTDHHLRQFGG